MNGVRSFVIPTLMKHGPGATKTLANGLTVGFIGATGYDAVKHLVLCRIERRPPKLDLDMYPYLPRANVATTATASYMSLLGGDAS